MTSVTDNPAVPRFRRTVLAAAAALALSLAATAGNAQPAAAAVPGAPAVPAMHGMHGGFDVMPRMLERVKERLNLNTSQQTMWDAVVAQGKAAREAGRANRRSVKDALEAELAKAEPDLAAVAAAADGVEQQNRALRRQVRDQWLALYATFSPEQKAVVRDLLQRKLARAESFHQRMRERIREHLGPAGT